MHQQQINAKEVKENILKFLEQKGPSLPVQVAKHVGLNSIFTSAFLSELASEGAVRISDMKVGGSPLYFTPDKIEMLGNFINHLGPKEREACLLLKEKGILEDAAQTPVIRVALRGLKDFAIPLKRDGKIVWEYFMSKGEVRQPKVKEPEKPEKLEPKSEEKKQEERGPKLEIEPLKDDEIKQIRQELEDKRKELERITLELSEKKEPKPEIKAEKIKKPLKKPAIKKKPKKISEKFLKEIKDILAKKQIELLHIEQFDRKQVFAKVRINDKEHLLAAYDKKKIGYADLVKASKKASVLNLPYYILSKGEPSKKTKDAIQAYRSLANIEKIEEIHEPIDSLKQ
jgi:hypothetical protein